MKNNYSKIFSASVLTALLLPQTAFSHFQELVPDNPVVTRETGRTLNFDIVFTHPMDGGPVMAMGQPEAMGVMANGKKTSLLNDLIPQTVSNKSAYGLQYKITRPGNYQFYLQAAPYYDELEQKFIKQHAKVVVDAYAANEGWDEPVGLPVEIMPLTRPYALWTGSSFTGVVTKGGEPQAGVEIEIEYRNTDGYTPPSDVYINQVIKSNQRGEFTLTLPRAGWWGMAAIMPADYTLTGPDGKPKEVSEDAVLWIHATDMK